MKASILINNFNYAPYLEACVESALTQDHRELEVVVVDDGSTDESRSVIASFGNRIVPILKQNGGQASCFNAGFAAATGDVIFLLDADDMFLPGKVSHVVGLYRRRDDIGWCFDHASHAIATAPPGGPLVATRVEGRADMKKGTFPLLPAPTSGLSFRRDLLARILPMPTAADITLSDNYLKFAAAYLAPGVTVEQCLTFQRLHRSNRYTASEAKQSKRAAIMIETGVALATEFPGLRRIGMHLVAGGLAAGRFSPGAMRNVVAAPRAKRVFGAGGGLQILALCASKRLRELASSRGIQPHPRVPVAGASSMGMLDTHE
jgi:glycosyltransferase involved in cell wall biosynthesis